MAWYDDLASWMSSNPGATGALVGGIGTLLDPAQAQTTTTSTNTTLPSYIAPYVGRLLSGMEAQAQEGYTPYTGQRVAGFTGDQQTAFNNYRTAAGAGGANPTMQAGAQMLNASATGLGNMRYTPDQYNPQTFGQAQADQYMSPYMQSVVDAQKREALRDFSQQSQSNNAAAVRAGAFGGSRHGVVEAEGQRNLQTKLGDIQATGLQNAFQNAQSQFNADQARGLQGFGMNSANQQAATQLGIGALGAQGQIGSALTNAGQQMWGNQNTANQNLLGAGSLQQANTQQGLDTGYQDFLRQQQYPYQQLQFMQSGLQGLPMTQYATANTTPAPTLTQQLLSSGLGGYQLGTSYGTPR